MKLFDVIAVPISFIILVLLPSSVVAQSPWQQITMPSVREAAASFAAPPREYGAIHWAIWGGQQSKERILADIARIDANGGGVYMINNSRGQVYRVIIVPTSTVIPEKVLERLGAFAAGGGKVVFVGRTPSMVVGRTFLNPEPAPDLSFATLESMPDITARVVAVLPKPDVQLDAACTPIKYVHRTLKDGDLYFFFNESDQAQSRTATVAGSGQVQVWDANSGTIAPLTGAAAEKNTMRFSLALRPYESKSVVVGPAL
jgi:hypothetical protein